MYAITIPLSWKHNDYTGHVFPVYQARALVSCIPPGLVICFTIDNIHAVLSKHPTLAFSLFFFKHWLLFIYLAMPGLRSWMQDLLVAACRLFSCRRVTLSCSLWDLVPWPEISPRPSALGAWSLSHWTTREVPMPGFLYFIGQQFYYIASDGPRWLLEIWLSCL